MKIATSTLTGALLDYYVARAEGVPAERLEIRQVPRTDTLICVDLKHPVSFTRDVAERLGYSTNWLRGGPLIEKYKPAMHHVTGNWYAELRRSDAINTGIDLLPAVCRAVVRAAFGDEVEDVPCV